MMVPNTNVWPSCLSVWNLSVSAFGHIFVALRGGLRICLARAGWVPAEQRRELLYITSP